MIKNIINTIKKNIRFDLPKLKKKILLYDEMHSSILREIINKDFDIIKVRNEKEIYFWIFLKQIIFLDFNFLTYCKNYIKYTSPKIIITFIDTDIRFYKLKESFKNIKFISIQNGSRQILPIMDNKQDNTSFFDKKKYLKNDKLKCDHVFVFNKYYIKEYQKIIDSNYHVLGNFKNNLIKIEKTKNFGEFLYLSSFAKNQKFSQNFQKDVLTLINLYLSRSGKKLHILLRSKTALSQKLEVEFYKNIFQSNCIFEKSLTWKKTYKLVDRFENIVFIFSTLGFESISRKKKVAIFSPLRDRNSQLNFGWPALYKKGYDFFQVRNFNYSEIKRVLTNIQNCSQSKWQKKYYKIIKDQLYLDANNTKLKKLISKLLKN